MALSPLVFLFVLHKLEKQRRDFYALLGHADEQITSDGLYGYGLCGYGLYGYGLYNYGLYAMAYRVVAYVMLGHIDER